MSKRTEHDCATAYEDPFLDRALASLQHFSPAAGFEDRVMARVVTPTPMWVQAFRHWWGSLAATGRLRWLLGGLAATCAVSLCVSLTVLVLSAGGAAQWLRGLLSDIGLPAWRAFLGITARVAQDVYSLLGYPSLPGAGWAVAGLGCGLTLLLDVWMLHRLMQPARARTVKLNAQS